MQQTLSNIHLQAQIPPIKLGTLGILLVLRAYVLDVSEGISRGYWYAWDDDVMGFFNPVTHVNFGSAAVSAAVYLIDNLKSANCSSSNDLWQRKIEARGHQFKVAWVRGINAKPRSFVLTGDAARWGLVPQSSMAGQTI
jgi:hypothetical protein